MARKTDGSKEWESKSKQMTVVVKEGDERLIEEGARMLGCSKSEFVRSAIRAFYASIRK